MLFFVKVRLDPSNLAELGEKLQAGAPESHPLSTWRLKDDPSAGLNTWEAEDQDC